MSNCVYLNRVFETLNDQYSNNNAGYSNGKFQAGQRIVLAVFGAKN